MSNTTSTVDMTNGVYRRLYAGFIRGRRINRVSFQAEHWFWRINALADDFGNLDANPQTLHNDASPIRRVCWREYRRERGQEPLERNPDPIGSRTVRR